MMAEDARERRREHQQALADRYAEERTATAAPAAED
jgi:nucleosome binding factor SPN SPT16 subunit